MTTPSMPDQPQADIIVVDDTLSDLKLISEILTEHGYAPRPTTSGALALESAKAKRPDLILLDIMMPEMDGVEVCRRLKADPQTQDVPVIFLSSERAADMKVAALQVGGTDYITKPFQPSEVLARIGTHLSMSRLQRQLVGQSEELRKEVEERKQAQASLQRHREDLEDIVEERTGELRQSEERFRSMFTNMSSGVAVYQAVDDGEDFVFLDCNPAAERISDIVRKDIIGKHLTEAFPSVEDFGLLDVLRRVWQTGTPGHLPITQYKDGRVENWLENFVYCLPSGEVVAIYDDVSERKRAEEERERASDFLQTVINGIPERVMVINRDFTVALTNRAGELAEAPDAGGPCPKCHQLSHNSSTPCDTSEHRCSVREVLASKEPVTVECIHHDEDGNDLFIEIIAVPIFDEAGEVKQVIQSWRDITERRREQEKLRLSEERLSIFLDHIPGAAFIKNEEGEYVLANEFLCKAFGHSMEDVLGATDEEIFGSEEALRFTAIDRQVIAEGKASTIEEQVADGETCIDLLTVKFPFPMRDGTLSGIGGLALDITKRKQAEREREDMAAQLRQSEKMRAIGQLAGGVAHDFNNMLCIIMGSADLLKIHLANSPAPLDINKRILTAAGRAAALTRKLLTFARNEKADFTPVDLHPILKDTVSLLQNTIDRNIAISCQFAASASMVEGNSTALQSAFLNLGINASHAMPAGGSICIRTRAEEMKEPDCDASPFALQPGSYIRIECEDTGHGIDPELLPRIFEPFFTTKEQGEGTGLGLSSAYGTVHEHGGAITVLSDLGSGTCFTILLPLMTESSTAEEADAEGIITGTGRILIVDDEEELRATLKALLKAIGYDVLVGESGEAGVELFRKHQDEVDLVIVDMIMPGMNGRECFAEIRKLAPEMPVILSSGYATGRDVDQMVAEGLNGFVKKPYRSAELSQAVRKALIDKG